MKSEFLIVTNGFKGTWSAIEYGAALAQSVHLAQTPFERSNFECFERVDM